MDIKKVVIGGSLGVGAILLAPLALEALGVVAINAGMWGVADALTVASTSVVLAGPGVGAAAGTVTAVVADSAEKKGEDIGIKEGTINTTNVLEPKIKEMENKFTDSANQQKKHYEELLEAKDNEIDNKEKEIQNKNKQIKEKDELIRTILEE